MPVDLVTWAAFCVGAAPRLTEEELASLARWEAAGAGTLSWPQWETITGRQPPKLGDPRPARKKKATIGGALRTAVMERDEYRCRQCGTHLRLSIDHIVAESKGGPTEFDNLQTLCLPCNTRKGAR